MARGNAAIVTPFVAGLFLMVKGNVGAIAPYAVY